MWPEMIAVFFIGLLSWILARAVWNSYNRKREEGNFLLVHQEDERVNIAIQNARDSLPLFLNEIAYPKSTQKGFSIKAMIPGDRPGSFEHAWINTLTFDGSRFRGRLGNELLYSSTFHIGDSMVVDLEHVSDWLYLDNGLLVGGFTIHALTKGMTRDEKIQFQQKSGFQMTENPIVPPIK